MLGYSWVFGPAGDKVRRTLAAFFENKGSKEDAQNYFAEFTDAVSVLQPGTLDKKEDTLKYGSLLFHCARVNQTSQILYALSCFFRINNQTLTVTLPCFQTMGYDFRAYQYYQEFLKDHSVDHNVYFGHFRGDRFEMEPLPRHTRKPDKRLEARLE